MAACEGTQPVVQEAPKSNTRRNVTVAAIIVGLLMIAAGVFSWFEDENLNNALIQTGAAQAVHNVVEQYPESKAYAEKAACVIEAAVEARTTSPDALATLLYDAAEAYTVPGAKSVLVAIINQINAAHKATDNEDFYLTKLLFLAQGIRDGCSCL